MGQEYSAGVYFYYYFFNVIGTYAVFFTRLFSFIITDDLYYKPTYLPTVQILLTYLKPYLLDFEPTVFRLESAHSYGYRQQQKSLYTLILQTFFF